MRGLRVAIESKFADHVIAQNGVLPDARIRATNGITHIAVALIYARSLRSASTAKGLDELD